MKSSLLEHNIIQEPLKRFSSPYIIRQELHVKDFDSYFVWKISIWAIFALYYSHNLTQINVDKVQVVQESNETIT